MPTVVPVAAFSLTALVAALVSTGVVTGDAKILGVVGARRCDAHWPPDGVVPPGTPLVRGYAHDDVTFAAFLDLLDRDTDVMLCQLDNTDGMSHDYGPDSPEAIATHAEADRRVRTVVADVACALAGADPATYDAVLLDVDNGPGQLVHTGNAEIYGVPFLRVVLDRLQPDGALVVWSAERSDVLATALRDVFGDVEEHDHEVRLQERVEHYWLYAARRPPSA